MPRPRKKKPTLFKRQQTALRRWSPVGKGPLPPLIQRMFMNQANVQAGKWAAPRQQAINTYTGALASQLAPVAGRVQGFYGQAQQGQAASDAALSSMLAGQGQQVAGDLSAQLAAAGQSTGGIQAGQVGQGAAGAAYALGSANLGRLLAQGAAASGQAAQLPGIARLGGLQHTRELQGQAQAQAQQFYQSSLDRELEKWIARTGLGMEKAGLGEQKRQFNVSAKQRQREFAADLAASAAKQGKTVKQLRDERSDKKERVTTNAARVARSLNRQKMTYGQAQRHMRQWLRKRLPWVPYKQLNNLALTALQEGGWRKGGGLPGGGLPGGTTDPVVIPGSGGGSGL